MGHSNDHESAVSAPADYRITEGSKWDKAWIIPAVLGVIGLIGAALGYASDPDRFMFSWLFGFMVAVTVVLGALFFVILQYLAVADWSASLRRQAELLFLGLPVILIAFLPIFGFRHELYEWNQGHDDHHSESLIGATTAHAQDHDDHGAGDGHGHAPAAGAHDHGEPHQAANGATGHTPQEAELHHHLLEHKAGWLNDNFWIGRAFFYILAWIGLGLFYFKKSTQQDDDSDPAHTVALENFAPFAMIIFGFTLTFAAFDWLMSLEPTWYSTIFGVYIFAGCGMTIHALLAVFGISLKQGGHLGKAVHTDHFHDLGKMMFGFTCFWAYIGFSQMMLQWYAGIPEEATYYHRRWTTSGWAGVSILLMVGHFALPFFLLMTRLAKRNLNTLRIGAIWMLVMQVIDIYWFVMPYANGGELSVHWLDLACLLAVCGSFFAVVFFFMRRFNLIALGDPRLSRAIHHMQSH